MFLFFGQDIPTRKFQIRGVIGAPGFSKVINECRVYIEKLGYYWVYFSLIGKSFYLCFIFHKHKIIYLNHLKIR